MVLATGGQELAIGRPGHFENFMLVALQLSDLPERRYIPEANRMIGADADKLSSIRREHDASHPGCVVGQAAHDCAGFRVPEEYAAVPARGGQHSVVRRERQRGNPAIM